MSAALKTDCGTDVHPLASFVPAWLLERFAARETATEPVRIEAVGLFADLSGYTKLAARLSELGSAGAEQLCDVLNAYFERLVRILEDHGGDVFGFAGDALLALWPQSNRPLDDRLVDAIAAALEIQSELTDVPIEGGLRLSLRISIGAGPVELADVAGGSVRQIVASGHLLDQLRLADPIAPVARVTLSPAAAAYLGRRGHLASLGDGHALVESLRVPARPRPLVRPKVQPEWEEGLRKYVPRPTLLRLDAHQDDWLSDIRIVTVLFARFFACDGQPASTKELPCVLEALGRQLDRYEGTLLQILADDKGLVALAGFGLPPLNHEDDALRAVRSGRELVDDLKRFNLCVDVGISTGTVFCGPLGSVQRRVFTVLGNVVNRGARLMQAADSGVLCDEITSGGARHKISFDALDPIPLKGFDRPVPVYRAGEILRNRSTQVFRPHSSSVGRLAEVEEVHCWVDEPYESGRALLIEGEAGIGKSSLVDATLARLGTSGVRLLRGASSEIERHTPYHVFAPVLTQLLGLDEATDAAQSDHVAESVRKALADDELNRLAPLVNMVLPLGLPENEITRQLDGKARADNLDFLIVALIRRSAADASVLIALEDAHWWDSASWRLARRIVERVPRVRLLVTARPGAAQANDEAETFLSHEQIQRLALAGLGMEEAGELVASVAGAERVARPLIEWLLERTQGHPLFLEQTVHLLLSAEQLEIIGGELAWSGRNNVPARVVDLPNSVRGLLESRLDRLDVREGLTLRVASVIGREFLVNLLSDVYPQSDERTRLPSRLESLSKSDLVAWLEARSEPAYLFRHALLQQTAYEQLPLAKRRELHRKVATWYEGRGSTSCPLPVLAEHYHKADLPEREQHYSAAAGEQALRNGANSEAVHYLTRAIGCLKRQRTRDGQPREPAEQARLTRLLAEAEFRRGRHDHAEGQLAEALELWRSPVHASPWRVSADAFWQIGRQLWHLARTRVMGQPARPRTNSRVRQQLEESMLCYERLVHIGYFMNRVVRATTHMLKTLNDAELLGQSPTLARCYAGIGIVVFLQGLRRLARHYITLAESVARSEPDEPSLVQTLVLVSLYRLGIADWQPIDEAMTEAVAIGKRLGDQNLLGQSYTMQAMADAFRGRYMAAAEHYERAFQAGRRGENGMHRAWGLGGEAECRLRLGEPQRAIRLLQDAEDLLEINVSRTENIRNQGLLAAAFAQLEDVPQAVHHAREVLRLAREFPTPTASTLEGFGCAAEVLCEHGTPEDAAEGLARLKRYTKVFPIGAPRLLWLTGRQMAGQGKSSAALKLWRDGLAQAMAYSMRWDEMLLCQELAGCAQMSGEERATFRQQAEDARQGMGLASHD
jgi:class 3 adenylate cyclase/tetratricopeptide (TPR) repeat protein